MADRGKVLRALKQHLLAPDVDECVACSYGELSGLECERQLYRDAVELLKAQEPQTVSGWVSVKDRMPKDGQDVLAYLNNGEETRIAPCNYFNGVWFDSVMNCVVVLQDVTHWMPLPEPPKEDGNG